MPYNFHPPHGALGGQTPYESSGRRQGPRRERAPSAAHVGVHRLDPAPRSLLATARHAQGGCLAFVRVEVTRGDRPVARETAGWPPTVIGPKASQASPMAGHRSRDQGEVGAQVGPSRTRNGTRRNRTRASQEEEGSGEQGERSWCRERAARIPVSKRRSRPSSRAWSPERGSPARGCELKTVGVRKPH
jgi:hypothetical protein